MTSLRHNCELLCTLLDMVKVELYASISEEGMALISDSVQQARDALAELDNTPQQS
jgi:hypothetical protein